MYSTSLGPVVRGSKGRGGGGIPGGGSAGGKKPVARLARGDGAVDGIRRQHFTEPDDVRSQASAAAGTKRRRFISLLPGWDHKILLETLHAGDVPVEFDHIAAAGALMQAIDVLRDERESRYASFDFHQREV